MRVKRRGVGGGVVGSEMECKRKKKGSGGGREGGNARERERELCEGTRLKRIEQSRAERSYFT